MYMKQGWTFCWLLLVLMGATLSGCGNVSIDSGSDESPANVFSDEVSKSGWRSRSIVADCVVTFYAADGSTYLSEQRHTIWPELAVLEVYADEPQGSFKWKLWGADFQKVAGVAKVDELPMGISNRNLAKLVLTSVTVGSDMGPELSASSELAKIDGRRYSVTKIGRGTTYSKTLKDIEVPWAKLTLYGDSTSGVIDRVVIEDVQSGLTLMAHSYNFWWLKEIGRSIPTKIDVFKIDEVRTGRQRILHVDYHTVKTQ
jgi:hypothetical protein